MGTAALGVFFEALPVVAVDRFLRSGGAAFGLGVLYAYASPGVTLLRRLAFPALAAALNLLSVLSAYPLGTIGERLGLPLGVGLGGASTLWAVAFACLACLCLGWRAHQRILVLGSLLAGALSFLAFAYMRETLAPIVPLTSLLACYWGVWMTLTTAAIALASRPR